MKKILVGCCGDCPYHKCNMIRFKGDIIIYYRCEHPEISDVEWTDGKELPEYCPLEDIN